MAATSSPPLLPRLPHLGLQVIIKFLPSQSPARVAFWTSTAWNLRPDPNIDEAMKVQTVAERREM